ERGLYEARGVDLEWVTVPQGTGAMCDKLEVAAGGQRGGRGHHAQRGGRGEGSRGRPLQGCGHLRAVAFEMGRSHKKRNGISSIADLKGKVFGVSRMLSGSHLMAYVMAHERGWDLSKDAPLKLCGTLDGAREAMGKGEIDAWLWEKFTTKFLVDSGEWDIVGEVPTPWPCFLIVASDRAIESHGREIRAIVEATSPVCKEFKANSGGTTFAYVAKHHALQDETLRNG
ncbi:unnamed protein product, partial [Prorocentrum cordatum]